MRVLKSLTFDDVNGGFLDLEMVREARVEELAGYLPRFSGLSVIGCTPALRSCQGCSWRLTILVP